jgi:hypothetical protein
MVQTKFAEYPSSGDRQSDSHPGISAITVKGYKSLQHEEKLAIAPLTLLAGANSSGKSSIMQPLLLLKQTLEAPYDPGALLLSGPNLKFTSANQLFTQTIGAKSLTSEFQVGIEVDERQEVTCLFQKTPETAIDLRAMDYPFEGKQYRLMVDMGHEQILESLPPTFRNLLITMTGTLDDPSSGQSSNGKPNPNRLTLKRQKCFLEFFVSSFPSLDLFPIHSAPLERLKRNLQQTIHVPGLRGNPERTYKTTAVGREFPGTFENYVASIVSYWQQNRTEQISLLETHLQALGLTSRLEAKQLNDTQVELQVGRLPCNSSGQSIQQDMVSIADVGFGVSQTLPVLLALLVANPGQLVYIEQPEIHLHPRAQVALAKVLAEAANRGVRVVVETHSELLLLGIQALVAEGEIMPDKVKLHWFTREETGATKITSADLDETGAFGDWPEDFGEIALATQNRYLSAAEARLWNDK